MACAVGSASLVVSARPLVSIVTPTLERAALLELTLRSVTAQTYPAIEHIVVDGGSMDGTVELLRHEEAVRGLRWVSEPDDGMYDAIDKGLRMARGEIVAYLNSDDLYFPWSVERAVEAFERDQEADLVFGDVIRVDEFRGITVPVFVPPYDPAAMAAYGTLHQPAVFFRHRVLEGMDGFDGSLRYVADLEFWLRAGGRYRFRRINEFLALEQRHPDMLSETSRERMAVEDARVRGAYRRGLWATRIGRAAAYVRWHWWSGRRWLAFYNATRGRGDGWAHSVATCHPFISTIEGAVGWFPSKGSRLRARIRWGRSPAAVASGEGDE